MNQNLEDKKSEWRNASLNVLRQYEENNNWLKKEEKSALAEIIRQKEINKKYTSPPLMIDKFMEYARLRVVEPKVIYDVGCADGKHTLEFAARFPQAQVYAFECNPDCLKWARINFSHQQNIKLIEGAVCDKSGPIAFYPVDASRHWNLGGSSLYIASGHNAFDPLPQYKIQVNGHRLDSLGLPPPDLVWMDLQGSELQALRGMGDLLSKTQVLYLEVSYKEVYAGQALWPEVREFLENKNFMCVRNWPADLYFGDAIFIEFTKELLDA